MKKETWMFLGACVVALLLVVSINKFACTPMPSTDSTVTAPVLPNSLSEDSIDFTQDSVNFVGDSVANCDSLSLDSFFDERVDSVTLCRDSL